ncbi:DUF2155 domain-containing protein [Rubellimicrobium aerolatum]|uniref:DUF2155 domain-containing protein n=1 Tax=Rubellimicrobium aerolatum TaxID=490979 RepID=A0ABW0S606_9RHOB|nr:DUF2155 domain-containing protein [Rubellimicrobium aerolatum]MBP1804546.1 hypothetical protein [Rubellimicrobium aerolatum]
MRRALLLSLLAAPLAAGAQTTLTLDPAARPSAGTEAVSAPGAVLRVLDKINGTTSDLELRDGETGEIGRIRVTLSECRYPADNPSGDAYALVGVRALPDDAPVFEGWLLASSPALSAVDHPRYDVWVLRCLGTS